jgi:prostaglandin-H2 D-isomerase / glutathione transferase
MKLTYFNVKGLAETSRILLAIADIEYEDYRYPLDIVDFKTHNMVKKEFDEDKASGKLTKSLGKVPFLEVDGKIIPQSKSIERYIAKRGNMMGSNEIESAQIDSICESVRDIKDAYKAVKRLPENEKEDGLKCWFKDQLVQRVTLLENSINDNTSNKHSVGNVLSLSDVVIYTFVCEFFDDKESVKLAISNSPRLCNIVDNVSNQPGVISWLKNRPNTAF